jgi:hypothetical protein
MKVLLYEEKFFSYAKLPTFAGKSCFTLQSNYYY